MFQTNLYLAYNALPAAIMPDWWCESPQTTLCGCDNVLTEAEQLTNTTNKVSQGASVIRNT